MTEQAAGGEAESATIQVKFVGFRPILNIYASD
jgi:hypothetical protein